MKRTRIALYDFLPYGAPELLEVRETYLARALATASLVIVAALLVSIGVSARFAARTVELPVLPMPGHVFQPPPSLDPPNVPLAPAPPAATPAGGGVVEPVPDEVAPADVTFPTQAELKLNGSGEGPASTGIVPPPEPAGPPALDEYVPYDEPPAVVTAVTPAYPDLAREAGVEGTVRLRVLVGRDGRVHDVHVDGSVPMLDEVACAAARRWVFTPALAGGHPVEVWVAIPIRFRLH